MEMDNKATVIIVNYNGKHLLRVCLASLFRQAYKNFEVFLVDNASSDGSAEYVGGNFPQVKVLRISKNLGFAAGNNIGIREAMKNKDVKYIVFLNSDTEANENWLGFLIKAVGQIGGAGVIASKILNFHNRKVIDSAGDFILRGRLNVVNRGKDEIDNGQYDQRAEVFSACAAASLFKRETLQDVCLNGEYFDEDFGTYVEDVDLNIRTRLRGWKCYYEPAAVVYHIGSATTNLLAKEFNDFVSRRNRMLAALKNFPFRYLVISLVRYFLPTKKGLRYYPILRSTNTASRLSFFEVCFVNLRATLAAILLAPRMLAKRRAIMKGRVVSAGEINRWFSDFTV